MQPHRRRTRDNHLTSLAYSSAVSSAGSSSSSSIFRIQPSPYGSLGDDPRIVRGLAVHVPHRAGHRAHQRLDGLLRFEFHDLVAGLHAAGAGFGQIDEHQFAQLAHRVLGQTDHGRLHRGDPPTRAPPSTPECSGTSRFNGVSFASLMPPAYNATRRRPNHTMGPAPPWGHRCGPIRQRTDVGGIGRYISGTGPEGGRAHDLHDGAFGAVVVDPLGGRPRTCSRSRASRSAPDRRPGCRSSSSPPCGSPRRR